jgi:GTPase SAR1 family protein
MEDINYRINESPVVFTRLENAQNIKKIAKIFANNKPNYELKPNPYFVIIVGAPGVGKTTKSQQIIKKELGLNYDDFYNISLDSLVERVKPYRNITKRLYNTLKAKKIELGTPELNEKNLAVLSEVYLPTIMSNKSNFALNKTEKAKLAKIEVLGNEKAAEALKKIKTVSIKELPSDLKHLNDMRKEGLKYGINHGLNIIYDTTLRESKNIIKDDIMSILETNNEIKYKIIVILVTADIKNIKNRIKGRHNKMLSNNDPYIRAINPKLTEMFVRENKEGFNIAKTYFKSNKYKNDKPTTLYESDDFTFIEVKNPHHNTTRKNNNRENKNNNWKYF